MSKLRLATHPTAPPGGLEADTRRRAAPRWWVRLAARLRRARLDAALADGTSPLASAELALRAGQLTGTRHRRAVADWIERATAAGDGTQAYRGSAAPLSRGEVWDARPNLDELAERLRSDEPVLPAGVARAEQLVTDLGSPLYAHDGPGSLAHTVRGVIRALG